MKEQETTTLLESLRPSCPRGSADPRMLAAMDEGYLRWQRTMGHLFTLAAILALALVAAVTFAVVPEPGQGYILGAMAGRPVAACAQVHSILTLS